jgi:hypothetical protein
MTRSLLVAALVALAALAPVAQAKPPVPDVPGEIAVADGNRPYLTLHAVGVQIYECNGQAWGLVAPRADLYDADGELVGTHYAGPSWQTEEDGSTVVASRVAGVNVDPTAVDWLLLAATPAADGRLGKTTFIQRINTTGGRAPAGGCDAGSRIEVPYTADYVFWR